MLRQHHGRSRAGERARVGRMDQYPALGSCAALGYRPRGACRSVCRDRWTFVGRRRELEHAVCAVLRVVWDNLRQQRHPRDPHVRVLAPGSDRSSAGANAVRSHLRVLRTFLPQCALE